MQKTLTKFFQNNFDILPKRICVAVSGGVDSMALCFALREICDEKGIKLFAVTVDHKMREGSDAESQEVGRVLSSYGIKHEILKVKNVPQKNIEAELRQKRYELIYEFCKLNQIKDIFVGHHKNDVAENFLIRLFRGSGLDGMASMQEASFMGGFRICRPFLDVTKEDLMEFMYGIGVEWFEDESNKDEKFLRNKIRAFLDGFEEKDLIARRIKKFGEVVADYKRFENAVLNEKAQDVLQILLPSLVVIDREEYLKLDKNIALKLLGLVLKELSGKDYRPRFDGLELFEKDLIALEKGKKRDFCGCFAQVISASNKSEFGEGLKVGDWVIYREKLL